MVAPTRQEAGCINYDLHRSNADPAIWMLYENWRSRDDLDLHFETPHLKAFLKDLDSLLGADMDLRYFSQISAPFTARPK